MANLVDTRVLLENSVCQIDAINGNIKSGSSNIENQIHPIGYELYRFKEVFTYGISVILVVGITGLLTRIAPLALISETKGSQEELRNLFSSNTVQQLR